MNMAVFLYNSIYKTGWRPNLAHGLLSDNPKICFSLNLHVHYRLTSYIIPLHSSTQNDGAATISTHHSGKGKESSGVSPTGNKCSILEVTIIISIYNLLARTSHMAHPIIRGFLVKSYDVWKVESLKCLARSICDCQNLV